MTKVLCIFIFLIYPIKSSNLVDHKREQPNEGANASDYFPETFKIDYLENLESNLMILASDTGSTINEIFSDSSDSFKIQIENIINELASSEEDMNAEEFKALDMFDLTLFDSAPMSQTSEGENCRFMEEATRNRTEVPTISVSEGGEIESKSLGTLNGLPSSQSLTLHFSDDTEFENIVKMILLDEKDLDKNFALDAMGEPEIKRIKLNDGNEKKIEKIYTESDVVQDTAERSDEITLNSILRTSND